MSQYVLYSGNQRRQGRRTDEQTIKAFDLGDLLDVLNTLNTLNLDNDQQVLVGSGDVVTVGSLESVRSEHGSETTGTSWWVLGP